MASTSQTQQDQSTAAVAVIGEQVKAMRAEITEIKGSISEINRAIDKLTTLEVEHLSTRQAMTRAFNAIDASNLDLRKLDERLRPIEVAMPQLIETRKWVMAMAGIALTVLLGAVIALVVKPTVNGPVAVSVPMTQSSKGANP